MLSLLKNFTSNEVFRKRFNYILQYRDEQNSKTKRRNSKENQEKTKVFHKGTIKQTLVSKKQKPISKYEINQVKQCA